MRPLSPPILRIFVCILSLHPKSEAQKVFLPLSAANKLKIAAIKTQGHITVDGRLDEVNWQLCKAVSGFTVAYPHQGGNATFDTQVMMMYDSVNLYIGAICSYSGDRKSLQVQSLKRDFGYTDNELFEVLIQPFKNPSLPVTGFSVSPYGNQSDIVFNNSVSYDYNWDAVWKAAAHIGDSTWTAELAIPFSSLRYPRDSTVWSINFARNIRHLGEYTGWSPWPIAYDPSRVAYAGLLTGIHPPSPKVNLRLQPYTLLKTVAGKTKEEAGGELKWALNTNTVLDATVNTDFAQADVDKQVVNLTRSSVFFPEKRQFFKENANLFSVGEDGMLQPFFSRRIGLSNAGEPITIDGGLRLVQQTDKHSAGLLFMRQSGDSINRPSWFTVLRYKKNISQDIQIGAMSVIRYDQSNAKQAGSWNLVHSIDAFARIGQQFYIRQLLSASTAGDFSIKGMASVTELSFANSRVYADVLETVAGKGYSAAAGFMERSDFIHTQPNLQLFIPSSKLPKKLAFYNPILSADIYHQASTRALQEVATTISPIGVLSTTGAEYRVNFIYAYEHTSDLFYPVNSIPIAPGRYRFLRYELYAKTNQAAHYSIEARVSTGKYYDVRLNSYYTAIRIVPIPHIAFGIGITENHFSGLGSKTAVGIPGEPGAPGGTPGPPGNSPGAPGNTTGPRGKTSRDTWLLAPELRLAWNANLQLTGFYQYNTDANTGSLNLRASWQYLPLSYVYLVFNSNHAIHPATPGALPGDQNAIAKVSYIRQL